MLHEMSLEEPWRYRLTLRLPDLKALSEPGLWAIEPSYTVVR
jgi:hypothetical protein